MASDYRPRSDSYSSSRRKTVPVSSSPAAGPSLRPSARKRGGENRKPRTASRSKTSLRDTATERPRSEKQRLADLRKQDRQRRQRERFFRRVAGLSLAFLLIAGIIFGIVSLLQSSTFDVTTISVHGTKALSKAEVRDLANVSSSSSLLLLKKSDVENRLLQQPWIKEVKLTKHLPHTLVIDVTERTPQAVVALAGINNSWLVSSDMVWLGKLDAQESTTVAQSVRSLPVAYNATTLIHILDIPLAHPAEGKKVSSPEVLNAVRILNGISESLRADTVRVSAPSVPKTKIFTKKGIEISLGSSEDIKTKDKIVRSILETQKGKVVLINVRAVDAPTWRGLNEN